MFLHGAIQFCLMLCLAHSKLLQTADDMEAAVGDNVTLRCRTDKNDTTYPIEWRYSNTTSTLLQIVYKRTHVFRERCEVVPNRSTGQYDLVIKNVQLSDAGRYTCDETGYRDDDHKTELIVFEKYPSAEWCKTTSASNENQNNCGLELVTLSCDLSYRANQSLRPTLEWLEGNGTILSADVKSNSDGSITSSIQLQKSQLETAKFTCRVRYPGSMTTGTSRFTWSPAMNIMPMEKVNSLSYGGCGLQTVECSDGKNPHCQYTWKDENGTEVSSSSSMDMAGKPNGNYTCFATCQVNQTPCSHVAKTFNYRCDDNDSSSTSTTFSPGTAASPESLKSSPGIASPVIYIPVAIIACLILITVVIVLLVRRIIRRSSSAGSDTTRNNYHSNGANVESGQSDNDFEMTHLNETKSQEGDVMLTTNTLATL